MHLRATYGGRGYLRFPELLARTTCGGSDCAIRIRRTGPARLELVVETADRIDRSTVGAVAERVRGQLVVFCQAPLEDFGLGEFEVIDDDGRVIEKSGVGRQVEYRGDWAARVPFAHALDMTDQEVADLANVIGASNAIRPRFVDAIQHSLTDAEGSVEAFLANYGVLESLLGKQTSVDSFLRKNEPAAELAKDSRGREVTMYTKLRNAKGHPTDMSPTEASARIRKMLPRLRESVRQVLLSPPPG